MRQVSEILGCRVLDRKGRPVGVVGELVVEPLTGTLAYVVVREGDEASDDRRLLPVPWSVLSDRRVPGDVRLPLPPPKLDDAPVLDGDGCEKLLEREVAVEIHTFYGVQPYWEGHEGDVDEAAVLS